MPILLFDILSVQLFSDKYLVEKGLEFKNPRYNNII